MDVPGRWAGGFRAWDEHGVYLATGRGAIAGRVLRVPAAALRERSDAWFPFGGHLIQASTTPRDRSSRRPGSASPGHPGDARRRPRPRAQQPGVGRHPVGRRPPDGVRRAGRGHGRLAGEDLPAARLAALDGLRHELAPAAGPGPAGPRRPRAGPGVVADPPGVERAWTIAPPLAAAGADPAWCARAAAVLEGPALQPGLEWVASVLGHRPAGRGEGVDPAHLRAGRRRPLLLASWTAPRCSGST